MATQTISEAQLEVFRTMTNSDGTSLNNNYRPPQPLGARTIYTTGVSKLLSSKDFDLQLQIHHVLGRQYEYAGILFWSFVSGHCLDGSQDTPSLDLLVLSQTGILRRIFWNIINFGSKLILFLDKSTYKKLLEYFKFKKLLYIPFWPNYHNFATVWPASHLNTDFCLSLRHQRQQQVRTWSQISSIQPSLLLLSVSAIPPH